MTDHQRYLAFISGLIGWPKFACDDEARWEDGVASREEVSRAHVELMKSVCGSMIFEILVEEAHALMVGRSAGPVEVWLPELDLGQDCSGSDRVLDVGDGRSCLVGP